MKVKNQLKPPFNQNYTTFRPKYQVMLAAIMILFVGFGCSGKTAPKPDPDRPQINIVGKDPVDSKYIKVSGSMTKEKRE